MSKAQATNKESEFQKVTKKLFEAVLPKGSRLRLAFSEEAGGAEFDTTIISHIGEVFIVEGTMETVIASNALVMVSFATNKALYSFVTRLVKMGDESAEEGFALKIPGAWKRLQRRENFRVESKQKIILKSLVTIGLKHEANSINISASGILVECGNILRIGDKYTLNFFLADDKPFAFSAEVTRIIEPDSNKGELRLPRYGLHFLNVTEKDLDRLAKGLWIVAKGMVIS